MSDGFNWSPTQQIRFHAALKIQLTQPVVDIIEEWLELGAYQEEKRFKNDGRTKIQRDDNV